MFCNKVKQLSKKKYNNLQLLRPKISKISKIKFKNIDFFAFSVWK